MLGNGYINWLQWKWCSSNENEKISRPSYTEVEIADFDIDYPFTLEKYKY